MLGLWEVCEDRGVLGGVVNITGKDAMSNSKGFGEGLRLWSFREMNLNRERVGLSNGVGLRLKGWKPG